MSWSIINFNFNHFYVTMSSVIIIIFGKGKIISVVSVSTFTVKYKYYKLEGIYQFTGDFKLYLFDNIIFTWGQLILYLINQLKVPSLKFKELLCDQMLIHMRLYIQVWLMRQCILHLDSHLQSIVEWRTIIVWSQEFFS